MKNLIKLLKLLPLIVIISACKTQINQDELLDNSKENIQKATKSEKTQMEKSFSCGEDGISKYLNEGWVIVKEYSEEKICSWKSFPATKDCDMEKDKGCKITKPDKIGEEKIYLLEK